MARLDEIRERVEKATPGPWFNGNWSGRCFEDHEHRGGVCKYKYEKVLSGDREDWFSKYVSAAKEGVQLIGSDDLGPILNIDDATFIAHAREALSEEDSDV